MSNKRNIAITAITLAVLVTTMLSVQSFNALASPSDSTAAPDQERYFAKMSGKNAWANWYSEDEETGIFTDAYIEVSDRSVRNSIDSSPRALAEMSVNQYRLQELCQEDEYGEEYCYYDYVLLYSFFGYKDLSKSDFNIATNLASARLNTEIIGYAYYCEDDEEEGEYCPEQDPISISVNAEWTGFGETYKGRDRYSYSNDLERVTEYSTGFFKQATSQADIVGDNVELHFDENSDYGDAHISKTRSGYFERISYG
jgi:hypothetical protein